MHQPDMWLDVQVEGAEKSAHNKLRMSWLLIVSARECVVFFDCAQPRNAPSHRFNCETVSKVVYLE